jgi:hypothetical protein
VKDSSRNNTVYKLRLSSAAFEVILDAIHILSARNQRFETLASVIVAATQLDCSTMSKALADLATLMPIEGDIKLFVRLNTESQQAFDRFRTTLHLTGMENPGVREAVMACALLIAPRD